MIILWSSIDVELEGTGVSVGGEVKHSNHKLNSIIQLLYLGAKFYQEKSILLNWLTLFRYNRYSIYQV